MRRFLSIAIVVTIAFSCTPFLLTSSVRAEEKMPNVKGKRLAVARQLTRLTNLELCDGVFYIAPQNWRNDIQPGVVYMQSPQPQTLLPANTIVAAWTFVKASSKQKVIEMPDLGSKNQQEAVEVILQAGLKAMSNAVRAEISSDVIVIDQYPRPGQPVYEGTSVHLTLKPKSDAQ